MSRLRLLPLAAGLLAATAPATSELDREQQRALLLAREVAANPETVAAVRAQNERKIPAASVQELDERWLATPGTADFMQPYLESALARRLRTRLTTAAGVVELFVMDDQGALVASARKTSDFWQGDEEKWRRAFAGGKGAEFLDKPRFDESSQSYAVQVSVPVREGRRAIGAVTVGLSLDAEGAPR